MSPLRNVVPPHPPHRARPAASDHSPMKRKVGRPRKTDADRELERRRREQWEAQRSVDVQEARPLRIAAVMARESDSWHDSTPRALYVSVDDGRRRGGRGGGASASSAGKAARPGKRGKAAGLPPSSLALLGRIPHRKGAGRAHKLALAAMMAEHEDPDSDGAVSHRSSVASAAVMHAPPATADGRIQDALDAWHRARPKVRLTRMPVCGHRRNAEN